MGQLLDRGFSETPPLRVPAASSPQCRIIPLGGQMTRENRCACCLDLGRLEVGGEPFKATRIFLGRQQVNHHPHPGARVARTKTHDWMHGRHLSARLGDVLLL